MGKASAISRIVKAAFTPHTAQFKMLKESGKLKGAKLALAYGAATLATPAYLALVAGHGEGDRSGALRAARTSLIGGLLLGPAGSAIFGMLALDNETNKLEQKRLEQEKQDNYFEYMYYNDEEFRKEYDEQQRKDMEEEDSQYDEFA